MTHEPHSSTPADTAREFHPEVKKSFFKTFALVVAVLSVLALLLMLIARTIEVTAVEPDPQDDTDRRVQIDQRLQPVTHAITSDQELQKVRAQSAEAGGANAMEGLNGEQVVQKVCGACHNTGMLGAPKTGDPAAWKAREQSAGGRDGLVAAAIKGKGSMPPKGGVAELTDDQIRQAIEFMER